jgi:hypothetical protein
MGIPFIPAILGLITGTYLYFMGSDEQNPNQWGEIFNPSTGTWELPDYSGDPIELKTPLGDIGMSNKILLLPVLWLILKYKPWK